MIQELAFADAAATRPVSVLRTRLKPYSIGHEIILQKKRNPIAVLSDKEFSQLPEDQRHLAVINAVLVCCQNWEQNQHPHKWLWLWSRRVRKENFSQAISEFKNYRWAGSTFPRFTSTISESSDNRTLGGAILCRLLNFAGGDFDAPFGLTQWRYFCAAEDDGRVHIENPSEQAEREEVEKHERDIMAELAAKKEATCQS